MNIKIKNKPKDIFGKVNMFKVTPTPPPTSQNPHH